MSKFIVGCIIFVSLIAGAFIVFRKQNPPSSPPNTTTDHQENSVPEDKTQNSKDLPQIEVLVKNLEVPWALAFLPDGRLLVTERKGEVKLLSKDFKEIKQIGKIDVKQIGEGGLHGIAAHPDFESNKFVYLYYTYSTSGNNTLNKVSRFKLIDDQLTSEEVIVDKIPGAQIHDGGRLKFGPDGYLYITTGDASNPSFSQDKSSLAGKILRVTDDGSPAPGNPFNSRIYSYGHRNPQGITWAGTDRLYEVEHGQSATDEINFIENGKNYGWPEIRGDQTRSGMESPFLHSGDDTWAPAGAAYFNGSIYFGGLRGQALYQAKILSNNQVELKTHFKSQFGRIRDVVLGPDQMLYITTSNKDGRGNPTSDDDRIIRINPNKL